MESESNKVKILGIQFRENKNSIEQEQACINREVGDVATVTYLSALDESVAWNDPVSVLASFDGVVLGGSGEFDFDGKRASDERGRAMSQVFKQRLKPLLDYVFEQDVLMLGICYGHQLLAEHAGVRVWADPEQSKTKSSVVTLTAEARSLPLFAGVPVSFPAQYGHKDSAERVPDGAVLLASGDRCQVSALRYKNNIYTTQFHPELTIEDLRGRIAESPSYLPPGTAVEDIFCDTPDASKILQNFGRIVEQAAQADS